MIVLDLICDQEHRFEAWFASGDVFETQRAAGLINCPHCNSHAVRRLPSAPYVQTSAHSASAPPDPADDERAPAASRRRLDGHSHTLSRTGRQTFQPGFRRPSLTQTFDRIIGRLPLL